jgi:hypothetical protein
VAVVPALVKKKRNLPGTPGLCMLATVVSVLVCMRTAATPSAPVCSDGLLAWPLPLVADPGAEVIALSPRTLLSTNRFVCKVCGEGF